jgi:hypothetical protein
MRSFSLTAVVIVGLIVGGFATGARAEIDCGKIEAGPYYKQEDLRAPMRFFYPEEYAGSACWQDCGAECHSLPLLFSFFANTTRYFFVAILRCGIALRFPLLVRMDAVGHCQLTGHVNTGVPFPAPVPQPCWLIHLRDSEVPINILFRSFVGISLGGVVPSIKVLNLGDRIADYFEPNRNARDWVQCVCDQRRSTT